MALSIKNREVEELARELARLTRKPITEAVRDGLKREVERERVIAGGKTSDDSMAEAIMEISRRSAARPILCAASEDEILGYDEFGIPTQ